MTVYLDSAATARPNQNALRQAEPYLYENFYNPSALYGGGVFVRSELKRAREEILSLIAPEDFKVVFTSGGTEADNQAVFCCAKRGNVVTTAGEHAAVYQSCSELKNRGIEVRIAPVRADGSVDEAALYRLVDGNTAFVSVMHVNNETGAVNDIRAISRRVKQINPKTLFMSDGVQAFGKIPFRLTQDIDLYSVSAHKIGGVKGTGALFMGSAVRTAAYLFGGGQEDGRRSGTENVFGIMCFRYAALEKFQSMREDGAHMLALRETLWERLNREYFVRISPQDGAPHILTVSARGMRGAVLQQMLSERGVFIGTGSACSSKKPYSRVIEACGYSKDVLSGVLRASFSPETTEEEIVFAAQEINRAAEEFHQRTVS